MKITYANLLKHSNHRASLTWQNWRNHERSTCQLIRLFYIQIQFPKHILQFKLFKHRKWNKVLRYKLIRKCTFYNFSITMWINYALHTQLYFLSKRSVLFINKAWACLLKCQQLHYACVNYILNCMELDKVNKLCSSILNSHLTSESLKSNC
jgi:hypothetical protein